MFHAFYTNDFFNKVRSSISSHQHWLLHASMVLFLMLAGLQQQNLRAGRKSSFVLFLICWNFEDFSKTKSIKVRKEKVLIIFCEIIKKCGTLPENAAGASFSPRNICF